MNTVPTPKRRLKGRSEHLLASSLGCEMLGVALSADFPARNPFRLLAVGAAEPRGALEPLLQRVRVRARRSAAAVEQGAVPLPWQERLAEAKKEQLVGLLGQLEDPRRRLLHELFWPHLEAERLRPLIEGRSEARDGAGGAAPGFDTVLERHAAAVGAMHAALARELGFAEGECDEVGDCWAVAHARWKAVVDDEQFWEYLTRRAEELGDYRLQVGDLVALRHELPTALLAYQVLFARAYETAGQGASVARHLQLLRGSPLAANGSAGGVHRLLHGIVDARLQALLAAARGAVGAGDERLHWKNVHEAFGEVVDSAEAAIDQFRNEFGLGEDELEGSFDEFANVLLSLNNGRIDYAGESRARALLASYLLTRRLLKLPLGTVRRARIQDSYENDRRLLLASGDSGVTDVDPGECWHCKGAPASPERSATVTMFKISHAELIGTSATYQVSHLFLAVPCSEFARWAHDGGHRDRLQLEWLPESCAGLVAELEAAEAEAEAEVAELENSLASREDCEKDGLRKQEQEAVAGLGIDVDAVAEGLEKHDAALEAAIAKATKAAKKRMEPHRARLEKERQAALEAEEERCAGWRGWRRFERVEFPLLVAALGAGFWTMSLPWVRSFDGRDDGSPSSVGFLVVASIVFGVAILAAIGLGAFLRAAVLRRPRPVGELEPKRDPEIAAIQQQLRQKRAALTAKADGQRKPLQDLLARVDDACREIREASARRVAEWRREVEEQRSEAHDRVGKLRKRLEQRISKLKGKVRNKASHEYPVCAALLRRGWKVGTKPSEADIVAQLRKQGVHV